MTYTAVTALKMRIKAEIDSPDTGVLEQGSRVVVREYKTLPSGSLRAQVARESRPLVPVGWITWVGKDGTDNLLADAPPASKTHASDAAADGAVAGPAQAFAIGAMVYVPRSRGQYESIAYVVSYEAPAGLYTIEVDSRGSGQCKICTADLMSAQPRGQQWAAMFRGATEALAVEVS